MATVPSDDARARAVSRLNRKRGFYAQAGVFVLITLVLIIIWAVGDGGFFWPVFPIIGFAFALGGQAWSIFGDRGPSEAAINREMRRDSGR